MFEHLTPENGHELLVIRNSGFVRSQMIEDELIETNHHLRWVDLVLSDTRRQHWVVFRDGEVAGSTYSKVLSDAPKNVEIGLYLAEEFAGKGIGALVLRFVIDQSFSEFRAEAVFVVVKNSNIRAIKLYEKVGFKRVGPERKSHFLGSGILYMCLKKTDFEVSDIGRASEQ